MRRAVIAIASTLIAATPVSSSTTPTSPSLRAPETGGRAVVLGGGAALADAGALTWNPAALAAGMRANLTIDHRVYEPGLTLQTATFALRPQAAGVLGVALHVDVARRSGVPGSDVLRGGTRGVPPRAGWRAMLAVGSRLGHGFDAGVAAGRMRGLSDWNESDAVWLADAGMAWSHAGLRCGVATRGLELSGGGSSPALDLGITQAWQTKRLLFAASMQRELNGTWQPGAGLEWGIAPSLTVRAGGANTPASPTAAIGAGWRHDGIRIDYACLANQAEGAQHLLSVAFDLGEPCVAPTPAVVARPVAKTVSPPTAPRPRAPKVAAPPSEDRSPGLWRVCSGSYPSLEATATDIGRLHQAQIFPVVEKRGATFVLVLSRGSLLQPAEALRERARVAGVSVTLERE